MNAELNNTSPGHDNPSLGAQRALLGHQDKLSRAVRLIAGCVLLIAAGLKFAEWMGSGPIFPAAPVWLLLLGWHAQVLVGVWLVSEVRPALAQRVASVFYFGLASVSAKLLIHGQVDCGCFGNIATPPWFSLALAIGFACLLWRTRPRVRFLNSQKLPDRLISLSAITTIAVIATFGAGLLVFTSSEPMESLLSRIRGEAIRLRPAIATSYPHEALPHYNRSTFHLINDTGRPVSLLSLLSSCNVWLSEDFPITIDAYSTRELVVYGPALDFPSKSNTVRRVSLITDRHDYSLLHVWIRATSSDPHIYPY